MGFWSALGSTLGSIGGLAAGIVLAPATGGMSLVLPLAGMGLGGGIGGAIGAQFDPVTGQYIQPQQQQYPSPASQIPAPQPEAEYPTQRGFLDVSNQQITSIADYDELLSNLDAFNRRGMS